MPKTFMAIDDPVHHLLREITRQSPLQPGHDAGAVPTVQYRLGTRELPEAYYALARFHALEGISCGPAILDRWRVKAEEKARLPEQVNYFDLTRLDRRCCRDLRLKLRKQGPSMLAAELLTYGTGTLRARNDDPTERVHQYLWSAHGRIQPRYEVTYATIRALHLNSLPLWHRTAKESFDSTNVIYGDAYGELEQLWERRADTSFLEHVARCLHPMRGKAEIAAYMHPPLKVAAVMKLHVKCQAMWKTPPVSARVLLRRLEYILSNTIVDSFPHTVFRRSELDLSSELWLPESGSAEWETDRSGYDGWLPDA